MVKPVFEDDYVLIVDKKPNLLVVLAPGEDKLTLTDLVKRYLENKSQTAFPCHRLDRGTSGLVVFAKDRKSRDKVMDQFRLQAVTKKYLAFVQGRFGRDDRILKSTIKPRGKPPKYAVTYCRVIKQLKDLSILEIKPKTGRSNQIRIHLEHTGHPVIGERKYTVAKRWPLRFKRLCLHSFYLQLRHPVSNDLFSVSVDLPEDLKDFLEKFGVKAECSGSKCRIKGNL